MGSGDEHLLTSYLIGSAGSQVSLAAIAPRLCADFYYAAASSADWIRRGACMTSSIRCPSRSTAMRARGRATARLKACLTLLGKLEAPIVRPPQPPVSPTEMESLRAALAAAGFAPIA